jgi:hypothetical protein
LGLGLLAEARLRFQAARMKGMQDEIGKLIAELNEKVRPFLLFASPPIPITIVISHFSFRPRVPLLSPLIHCHGHQSKALDSTSTALRQSEDEQHKLSKRLAEAEVSSSRQRVPSVFRFRARTQIFFCSI